jgi:dTDP-glucose 4,6-dehydratase
MDYRPSTVLVTGGAGFIGSNFVHHLLRADTRVRIINLDSLTYAGSLDNLSNLADPSRHTFVHGDICDRPLVGRLLDEHGIDTVVHFAAESHVDRSISDPAFVETTPYAPNSPYSASKAASDHLVRAYFHTYGLPVVTTHCSNNYGPRQHAEKFIPTVIRNCLAGTRIPVYGDGQNVRDWLYVDDHCDALQRVLTKGKAGETYNIGGCNEWRNSDVVALICRLLDERLPERAPHMRLVEFVTDRAGHDRRYAIDTAKISDELDWGPAEDFETGIAKTIDWQLGLTL